MRHEGSSSSAPSPSSSRVVHLNGKLVPEADARISPFDRGFLLGDGVFETMRAYGGRCFALDEHLARLEGSCALMRLTMPEGLPAIVDDVLRANQLADAAVRITVTRGPGGRGASPTGAGPPTLVVHALPIVERPEVWGRGLRLASTRRHHAALPGAKTVDYAANVVARIEAEEAGADEALFVSDAGTVIEATQANVFALFRRELVTPPLESGCLPGVTRATLLRLAPDLGLAPVERALTVDDLLRADEVLLSASILEVAPIVAVDGAPIGSGAPGDVARALHGAYRSHASRT